MPVVQVLSPRGVEYVFLTINLFTAAAGLISVLLALVNGKADFNVLAFPVALLVVSVPLFALLFLRLKKAELRDPSLRADASKRRSTQFTQVVAYLVVFFSLIGFVTAGFAKASGDFKGSFLKLCLDVLVLVVVAGGILAYYWWDEHKAVR
jgi:divalent metal cation (Fe/Co/Zn/Cd) transporter